MQATGSQIPTLGPERGNWRSTLGQSWQGKMGQDRYPVHSAVARISGILHDLSALYCPLWKRSGLEHPD